MGEMRVMGIKGDVKIIWDSDNNDETAAARDQFDTLTKKGFAAFTVDKRGEKGEQIKKFDANAEKLILVPALRGG